MDHFDSTEEPDEDEEDENSEEEESEEELTETPKTPSPQPPYSLIPPPPVWVQRNQGLSMRTRHLLSNLRQINMYTQHYGMLSC